MMLSTTKRSHWSTVLLVVVILAMAAGIPAIAASNQDLLKYALCDLQVLYVFEDPERIDWPTIYYLNDNYGCRVDLLTLSVRSRMDKTVTSIADREINLYQYQIQKDDTLWADRLINELFRQRRPDVVIFDSFHDTLDNALKDYLLNLPRKDGVLFNIRKIYQLLEDRGQTGGDRVIINRRELMHRYRDRIGVEVRQLYPWFRLQEQSAGSLVGYQLLKSYIGKRVAEVDFLSGLEPMRLVGVIDSLFTAGPKQTILKSQAGKFLSFYSLARRSTGQRAIDLLVDGYHELGYLYHQDDFGPGIDSIADFRPYLADVFQRAERAALQTIGINWDGEVIVRDSPHGPKVKFHLSLSADSPLKMTVKQVTFHPYWDTAAVILDDVPRVVSPHQSLVREYLVNMDRAYLEAKRPESLLFRVEVQYRKNRLTLTSSHAVWEAPELQVSFMPDFCFIPPFDRLDVDRVVSSMNVKAVITKPSCYADSVKLKLETPHGMFAGAYSTDHYLEKGMTRKTVRIPFTISNLFEKGIQQQTITLSIDGKLVAADTGLVRIASCHVDDKVRVGYLPDTSGMLEDVLRMTDAGFQPLTDRTLLTYDLFSYNVIVIGSGALREYPSFHKIKDRLEEYLRQGGSLVLLGQPHDWPHGVLPVAFAPATEYVDQDEITNRIPEARILTKPYLISDKNLFSSFYRQREVTSAVISPAERVYVTPSGGTLLSVSRLGDGQIIYCGLPLLQRIAKLDIDAIHLFANIVNY